MDERHADFFQRFLEEVTYDFEEEVKMETLVCMVGLCVDSQ